MSNPKARKGLVIALGVAAIFVLAAAGVLLTLYLQGQAQHRRMRAAAAVTPEEKPVNLVMQMKRPPKDQQVQYVAYFTPGEDQRGPDIDSAPLAAAKDAKARNLSVVVTCHSNDAHRLAKDMQDALARQREEYIANIMVGQGLDISRIQSDWGDPSIKTVSSSTDERPTCEIDTALPVGEKLVAP